MPGACLGDAHLIYGSDLLENLTVCFADGGISTECHSVVQLAVAEKGEIPGCREMRMRVMLILNG
jgi:hypothetical protein